jgi:hypothetical protein
MIPELTDAIWRKSSYSGSSGGQCVEVAANLPGIVAVRDSKNPAGPALVLTPQQWAEFVSGAREGEFSL